jgi:tetratricopeptide (TPR) repeat protein
VLETDCVGHLRATPYRPVVELLRACLAIDDTDGAETIRRKISDMLGEETREPAATAPLLWLLNLPVDDPQWAGLEAHQRRQWVVDAFKGILVEASRSEPLIVLVEDVHWADPETRMLLDDLVESVPSLNVLLLLSFRSEHRHRWGHGSDYYELRLDPLPPASAAQLLEDLMGADPALDSLKQLLVARTDGNPFFLEEMARTLRETGVLSGERGACRLARAVDTVHVPSTVQPIIAARVDGLPESEKRLLQTAAVVGLDVPLTLLQAIAEGASEAALRAQLAHLRDTEFLYESQLYPELVYSFRHGLAHEVVYDGMLTERRRALHAALVGAIERLHAGWLDEHVERLAHHALRGEQWDKAVNYLRQAGARARERAANREAVAWLTQALGALTHLAETPTTLTLAIDLRFDLRGSLYPLGEFELIVTMLREAEKLGAALGDDRRLAWVAFHLGECLRLAGRLIEAREQLERARAAAGEFGDLALQVAANQYLCLTRHALGDYAGAAADMRTVLSFPLEPPDVAEFSHTQAGSRAGFRAVSTCWLARCLAETGAFEEALDAGRDALQTAEGLPHPYPLAVTRWGLGSVYALRGDLAAADVLLTAALAGSEAAGLTVTLPQVTRMVGWVRAMAGRPDEGLDFLTRALAAAESMRIEVAYAAIWGQLGEVHLLKGRQDEAERFGRLALERAHAAGQRGDEARAVRLLGEISAARGPDCLAETESAYLSAAALASAAGMRPLVARCHLDLGRLFRKAGNADRAARHLATASEMFTVMGMATGLAEIAALA